MTYMINKLIEEFWKLGLEVNTEKTEYMDIGSTGQIRKRNKVIKNFNEYEYLGVTTSKDWKDKELINKRLWFSQYWRLGQRRGL